MRKGLKVSRGLQIAGALSLIVAIVVGSTRGQMGAYVIAGIALIVGARIYEWLSKE